MKKFFIFICFLSFSQGSLVWSQELTIEMAQTINKYKIPYAALLVKVDSRKEAAANNAKELLEPVALQAFKMVDGGKDKEKLFDEWNMMLTDIFLNEYSDPKGYAKTYISDCMS